MNEKAITAAHEAGHAVAAWHFGALPLKVTIRPGKHVLGYTQHDYPRSVRAEQVITLAGLAANIACQGMEVAAAWPYAGGDMELLEAGGFKLHGPAYLRRYGDAVRILGQRFSQWHRLTCKLMETGELDWRELAFLLSRRRPVELIPGRFQVRVGLVVAVEDAERQESAR